MHRLIQSRVLSLHKLSSNYCHPPQLRSLLKNVRFYCNPVKPEAAVSSSDNVNSSSSPSTSQNNHKVHPPPTTTENDMGWVDKLVYSSYLEQFLPPPSIRNKIRKNFDISERDRKELVIKTTVSPPVAVSYLLEDNLKETSKYKEEMKEEMEEEEESSTPAHFPFKIENKTEFTNNEGDKFNNETLEENENSTVETGDDMEYSQATIKVVSVGEKLKQVDINIENVLETGSSSSNDKNNLMEVADCMLMAGTANPSIPASSVPCGGCGALLHCQDKSIPGYISSEKFKGARKRDLMGEVCYRCSILESHQATLDVNVSPKDYPRIVSKINETFSMVLLLVDVTDFPCSVWPGILDIIGTKRPIFLVGNKVDMIPQDSPDYLTRLEESLIKCAVEMGMIEANVIHTALISAKTGFGVENLISSVFRVWRGRGDVFIMGCTNVGKSSLFNLFLKSDLCKPQVSDRVQRATISQWPGTTLNMLKFPMVNPQGFRMSLRQKRLMTEHPVVRAEKMERIREFEVTKNPELITLSGYVGRTFVSKDMRSEYENSVTVGDLFQIDPNTVNPPSVKKLGQWNPEAHEFTSGRWVYDTPGAVSTNQILDLLTLPELMQSLPRTLIQPRTYFIKPQMTFFLGGLVRIDYLEGDSGIRFTVFANSGLPVTMASNSDADYIYKKAFGTQVFGVPTGNAERLAQFPDLLSKEIKLKGTGHNFSCADIVLSSIGWIAVSAGHARKITLSVYTPEGKGIFIREPSLLPYAVNWKGKRIRGTYTYLPHKLYEPHKNYRIRRPAPLPYLELKNRDSHNRREESYNNYN